MKKTTARLIIIINLTLIFTFLGCQLAFAETLQERMNNLIGPKKQYNTMLSPIYLRSHVDEESISPQSGELSLAQTDYVLPGRNGLDLEIKRLYKSGVSNVQEMKVRYMDGVWIDDVYSDNNTTSFFEERYNLGIGMRFSIPTMEIKQNSDNSSFKFIHTDTGDTYKLTKDYQMTADTGITTYKPEGQTVKDVIVKLQFGI